MHSMFPANRSKIVILELSNGQQMLLTGVSKIHITDQDVSIYSPYVFILKSKSAIRRLRVQ
jgi:hypothetical protein